MWSQSKKFTLACIEYCSWFMTQRRKLSLNWFSIQTAINTEMKSQKCQWLKLLLTHSRRALKLCHLTLSDENISFFDPYSATFYILIDRRQIIVRIYFITFRNATMMQKIRLNICRRQSHTKLVIISAYFTCRYDIEPRQLIIIKM
jgi:hypothetical protein